MDATTITVTVLVVLLIVAVAALLMKINKDSKRMDALGSESLVKRMANPPIERPAVMRSAVMPPPPRMARPAVMRPAVMPPPSSMIRPAVMPRRPEDNMRVGSLTLQKAKAAAEAAAKAAAAKETPPNAAKEPQAPVDDIENVGDQSLMLDEDPSQEYDEMAEETGIAKIAIPQPDENWIKSRQVQPVKDLSVGIAITNDVSKQDNLQAGKITSKFPIRARPAVMPPMFPHKGPQMMRPAVMPHMPPHKGPRRDMPPMLSHKGPQGKPAYFEAMRAAAAKAAQERDAKARSMVDKRARSMAENAEMQALKRIDNSGVKQYDMKKAPPQARFGIDMGMGSVGQEAEKKVVMEAEEAANKAVMKAATMQAEEADNKAAMRVEGYEMMKPWGSMVY